MPKPTQEEIDSMVSVLPDDGCRLHEACLTCPFAICRTEYKGSDVAFLKRFAPEGHPGRVAAERGDKNWKIIEDLDRRKIGRQTLLNASCLYFHVCGNRSRRYSKLCDAHYKRQAEGRDMEVPMHTRRKRL